LHEVQSNAAKQQETTSLKPTRAFQSHNQRHK
jgi:hypothetical protein